MKWSLHYAKKAIRLINGSKYNAHTEPLFKSSWIEFKNENVKNFRNKTEFKISLKNHLLGELFLAITCNRLLCPSCHLNA